MSTAAFFTATVQPDGASVDAWPAQPLLMSLEQGSVDWPSSCRSGNCRTCIGQLLSGQVRYEMEWPGLTTEELDAGCVLPCVAYPVSDVSMKIGEGL